MSVIRRGLLVLTLATPLLFASFAADPASVADSGCNGESATTGGAQMNTFVCLTIDAAPTEPEPISSSGGGPPVVCWLEPQYTPAALQTLITQDANLSESQVGEGVQLYSKWLTNYGSLKPAYDLKENGYWWGVGCELNNLNASTYEQQLWAEVGLSVWKPWEFEPNHAIPAAPPGEVTTPAMLAQYAKAAAPLDAPSGQMSPKWNNGASTQTVGLTTYFWGQIGDQADPVTQHTIVASIQWLSSTVVAVPLSVTITTTGTTDAPDNTLTCPVTDGRFGTAVSGDAMGDTSACSFKYTEPSSGPVQITMVTKWKVSWNGGGVGRGWTVEEPSQTTYYRDVTVQEVQAVNN